ncbi:hypothetical protein [Streptomyces bicolor]|uniref:hypothetical protein n=1 Tax=Streptomyces bicolor TaxID=66874 RepID=UPI0004E2769F|nr:hypothetical protein [Streptomyces bicolor]
MTRSQRLAALAVGAILLVGIPVAGAHRAPPPDLGEPVVVGRTEPGPTSGSPSVPPADSRATEPSPTRPPSPGATTRTPFEYDGEDAVAATTSAKQPEDTDPERTDTAQPVPPKAPMPAGRAADDDMTPEATASATPSATASATASDDGDDDDTGEDG